MLPRLILGVPTSSSASVMVRSSSHVSFGRASHLTPILMHAVCHGIELPFVFHSVKPFYNFTVGEAELSKNMVTYGIA